MLNKEFGDTCDLGIDNELSVHFEEVKNKCIPFSREKEYLGCCVDANLS